MTKRQIIQLPIMRSCIPLEAGAADKIEEMAEKWKQLAHVACLKAHWSLAEKAGRNGPIIHELLYRVEFRLAGESESRFRHVTRIEMVNDMRENEEIEVLTVSWFSLDAYAYGDDGDVITPNHEMFVEGTYDPSVVGGEYTK